MKSVSVCFAVRSYERADSRHERIVNALRMNELFLGGWGGVTTALLAAEQRDGEGSDTDPMTRSEKGQASGN